MTLVLVNGEKNIKNILFLQVKDGGFHDAEKHTLYIYVRAGRGRPPALIRMRYQSFYVSHKRQGVHDEARVPLLPSPNVSHFDFLKFLWKRGLPIRIILHSNLVLRTKEHWMEFRQCMDCRRRPRSTVSAGGRRSRGICTLHLPCELISSESVKL